jgi:ketosteroid isomerase-like protein
MARHRYVDSIARYFNAANAGDPAGMLACFADDIAVYTTGIAPRFGAAAVAQLIVELHSTRARWTIDHCLVQEPEAVVEWSMLLVPPGAAQEAFYRGIDWFAFDANDRIVQIREFLLTNPAHAGKPLEQFPYADRGYPMGPDLDERLPN